MVPRKKPRREKPPLPFPVLLMQKKIKTARQAVFRILEEYQRTGEFVTERLSTLDELVSLESADRRLVREMVSGVIRRKATLETLITSHVNRPRENIEDPLWLLLQMGAYELAFLDSIPPHATVNETTELARYFQRPRWTGIINGTLRSLSSTLTTEPATAPARNAFPVRDGLYRTCQEETFTDPETDPGRYFSAAFSFPPWLVKRWRDQYSFLELLEIGFWFNAPAPLVLRVNPLKTTRDALLEAFASGGILAEPAPMTGAICLQGSHNIPTLPGFAEGHFSVQDLTAMKAVELLNPKPGENVWDFCAAPGTKTSAMAERMQNQGRILATDIKENRLAKIEENKARLGLDIIEIQEISQAGDRLPVGPFDAVLVDVPCSNTGVLGKRVEARWRIKPADLEELPLIQNRLLTAAYERTKPGGRIVYSTCSLEPEENQNVVQSLLDRCEDLTLIESQTHKPGQPSDGGFAALLQKAERGA